MLSGRHRVDAGCGHGALLFDPCSRREVWAKIPGVAARSASGLSGGGPRRSRRARRVGIHRHVAHVSITGGNHGVIGRFTGIRGQGGGDAEWACRVRNPSRGRADAMPGVAPDEPVGAARGRRGLRAAVASAALGALGACSGADAFLDAQLEHQLGKAGATTPLELGLVGPANWTRACVLGPYTTDARARALLGFDWPVEGRGVTRGDERFLLVFTDSRRSRLRRAPARRGGTHHARPALRRTGRGATRARAPRRWRAAGAARSGALGGRARRRTWRAPAFAYDAGQ